MDKITQTNEFSPCNCVLNDQTMLELALSWGSTASNQERFHFLKKFVQYFKEDEIKGLDSAFSNAKRKLKKEIRRTKADDSSEELSVCMTDLAPVSNPVLLPVCSKDEDKPWFENISPDNIVAMDCEFLISSKMNEYRKYDNIAAVVSVVNYNGEEIYYAKIKHNPEDVRVTEKSSSINGFKNTDFQSDDCKDIKLVQNELAEILKGKLVVTVDGANDFDSLDLSIGAYTTFDLQQYYQRWNGDISKKGEPILQKMGLSTIYYHYYNIDIHDSNQIHDAKHDAIFTMQVFREKYSKLNILEKATVADKNEFEDTIVINDKYRQRMKAKQRTSSKSELVQDRNKKKKNNLCYNLDDDDDEDGDDIATIIINGEKVSVRLA